MSALFKKAFNIILLFTFIIILFALIIYIYLFFNHKITFIELLSGAAFFSIIGMLSIIFLLGKVKIEDLKISKGKINNIWLSRVCGVGGIVLGFGIFYLIRVRELDPNNVLHKIIAIIMILSGFLIFSETFQKK